jgi:hypothetical protein
MFRAPRIRQVRSGTDAGGHVPERENTTMIVGETPGYLSIFFLIRAGPFIPPE